MIAVRQKPGTGRFCVSCAWMILVRRSVKLGDEYPFACLNKFFAIVMGESSIARCGTKRLDCFTAQIIYCDDSTVLGSEAELRQTSPVVENCLSVFFRLSRKNTVITRIRSTTSPVTTPVRILFRRPLCLTCLLGSRSSSMCRSDNHCMLRRSEMVISHSKLTEQNDSRI